MDRYGPRLIRFSSQRRALKLAIAAQESMHSYVIRRHDRSEDSEARPGLDYHWEDPPPDACKVSRSFRGSERQGTMGIQRK